MRGKVKQVIVRICHRMTREIKKFRNSKADSEEVKQKKTKKANRLAKEIKTIKVKAHIKLKVLVKIAISDIMKKAVAEFRVKYPNWLIEIPNILRNIELKKKGMKLNDDIQKGEAANYARAMEKYASVSETQMKLAPNSPVEKQTKTKSKQNSKGDSDSTDSQTKTSKKTAKNSDSLNVWSVDKNNVDKRNGVKQTKKGKQKESSSNRRIGSSEERESEEDEEEEEVEGEEEEENEEEEDDSDNSEKDMLARKLSNALKKIAPGSDEEGEESGEEENDDDDDEGEGESEDEFEEERWKRKMQLINKPTKKKGGRKESEADSDENDLEDENSEEEEAEEEEEEESSEDEFEEERRKKKLELIKKSTNKKGQQKKNNQNDSDENESEEEEGGEEEESEEEDSEEDEFEQERRKKKRGLINQKTVKNSKNLSRTKEEIHSKDKTKAGEKVKGKIVSEKVKGKIVSEKVKGKMVKDHKPKEETVVDDFFMTKDNREYKSIVKPNVFEQGPTGDEFNGGDEFERRKGRIDRDRPQNSQPKEIYRKGKKIVLNRNETNGKFKPKFPNFDSRGPPNGRKFDKFNSDRFAGSGGGPEPRSPA
ncbi:ABC transporter F family member 4 [Diaphorina citri]|uniref:ABC transporter F family member 4 n=1 Tax=Diaphorina citri TaxID=121845 RepID=A0A1S4ESH2_DIACI|nr:ABC transporter F family member 4 [Diaphorina citri]